jgi:hypothetical protein
MPSRLHQAQRAVTRYVLYCSPSMTPNTADKLKCAERELKFRRRVYPRFVQNGQMTQADADREIATMSASADDYRQQLQPQML